MRPLPSRIALRKWGAPSSPARATRPGSPPAARRWDFGEVAGVGGQHADPATGAEAGLDERQLQQARGEDRDGQLAGERVLEQDHEAAGGRQRPDPGPDELPAAAHERLDQSRIALPDEPFEGRPRHGAVGHREGEGFRVADVAGDPPDARVHDQDADDRLFGCDAHAPDTTIPRRAMATPP